MHRSQQLSDSDSCREAFTLMEVTAALMLTALLAAVASRQFRVEARNVLHAEQAADTIRLELNSARQSAILKSEPYGLAFLRSKGRISAIQRFRQDGSGKRILLGEEYEIPEALNEFSVNSSAVTFNNEGAATGASKIRLGTEHRTWAIDIYAVTGMVRLSSN